MNDYLERILRARVYDVAIETPLELAGTLSERTRNQIWLKREDLQPVFSFKLRGAYNKMVHLSPAVLTRGVICSSAGNHAQGVALSAQRLGCRALVVMPTTTPRIKIDAVTRRGAEVILHGDSYSEAYAQARLLERERGLTFVHPFDDPDVIAGQGTIGMEIVRQARAPIDAIFVAIGGGGLISGIATAAKAIHPKIRIIGVVSDQAPGMKNLFEHKQAMDPKKRIATIAEGIAVKNPSPQMYDTYISKLVDQVVAVSDDEIAKAIVFLIEKGKLVTEGSGAAGFAAVMSRGDKLGLGKKSCVVLCGGNIDMTVMSKVIERGLREEHRLARLTLVVDDLPGNLNRLTTVMASMRANILEVYHDRVSPELGLRETRIDFLVETASLDHISEIKTALKEQGFKIISD